MTSPQKAKGSQFERDVAKYFQERGYWAVERRYGAGNTQDKGDLQGMPEFVFECKNLSKITLASIVDEALVEQGHARARFGVSIIKRRRRPTKDSYVVMTLEQWIDLLNDSPSGKIARPGNRR